MALNFTNVKTNLLQCLIDAKITKVIHLTELKNIYIYAKIEIFAKLLKLSVRHNKIE